MDVKIIHLALKTMPLQLFVHSINGAILTNSITTCPFLMANLLFLTNFLDSRVPITREETKWEAKRGAEEEPQLLRVKS